MLPLLLLLAAVVHGIPIDNAISEPMEVECQNAAISLTVPTEKPWKGRLYVPGRAEEPGCFTNADPNGPDVMSGSLTLDFDSCGVSRRRSLNPPGIYVYADIIMSFHPIFETKVDRALRLQCFYMEADKTVSTGLDVSGLTTDLRTFVVPMPNCVYRIVEDPEEDNPEPLRFATIGQPLFHKWTCDDPSARNIFCMTVHSCYVQDGADKFRAELLDVDGCAIDQYLLGNIEYVDDQLMAFREVHAYKFADNPSLYYNCQIKLTVREPNGECPRPQCQTPAGFAVAGPGSPRLEGGGGVQPASAKAKGTGEEEGGVRRRRSTWDEDDRSVGEIDVEPEHALQVANVGVEEKDIARALRQLQHDYGFNDSASAVPSTQCIEYASLVAIVLAAVTLSVVLTAIGAALFCRKSSFVKNIS